MFSKAPVGASGSALASPRPPDQRARRSRGRRAAATEPARRQTQAGAAAPGLAADGPAGEPGGRAMGAQRGPS